MILLQNIWIFIRVLFKILTRENDDAAANTK